MIGGNDVFRVATPAGAPPLGLEQEPPEHPVADLETADLATNGHNAAYGFMAEQERVGLQTHARKMPLDELAIGGIADIRHLALDQRLIVSGLRNG